MAVTKGGATQGGRQPEPEPALAVHRLTFRAEYHEVDAMGVTYYGNYLNWFTRGRIELLRHLGMRYADWERQGLYLPVLRVECEYRSPVPLDEEVQLETRLTECNRTRMSFVYRVFKGVGAAQGEGPLLCALGTTHHAYVDERGKPIDLKKRFPEIWERLSQRERMTS